MTTLQGTKRMATVACVLLALGMPAFGAEPWQDAFEQTCSRTNEAMNLSADELRLLLGKCDELRKVIETKDESVRRVYLKRLQLCRNLYAYMLEYKQGEAAAR